VCVTSHAGEVLKRVENGATLHRLLAEAGLVATER